MNMAPQLVGYPALELENLHKSFGKAEIIRGVDLSIAAGTIFKGAASDQSNVMICRTSPLF